MMDFEMSACHSDVSSKKCLSKLASCGAKSWMHSMQSMDSVAIAYVMFVVSALACMMGVKNMDVSSSLTLGLGLQCLAFASLAAHVDQQKSLKGVSIKMLSMYAGVSGVRLCSTTLRNGYLPDDATGDFVYQMCDFVSLFIAIGLIVRSKGSYRSSYNEEADSLTITPLIAVSVVMAILIHGDLNASPFFDTVWMTSLNLDTVAMLPQLWMLTKVGGKVPSLMGHFIACMVFSRMSSLFFWCVAYPELAPLKGGYGGMNLPGLFIVLPQLAQVLVAGDFLYLYVKSHLNNEDLVLPTFEV